MSNGIIELDLSTDSFQMHFALSSILSYFYSVKCRSFISLKSQDYLHLTVENWF